MHAPANFCYPAYNSAAVHPHMYAQPPYQTYPDSGYIPNPAHPVAPGGVGSSNVYAQNYIHQVRSMLGIHRFLPLTTDRLQPYRTTEQGYF